MPLQTCSVNGKSGWRWGEQGKCYAGPSGKKKAMRQAVAISYHGGEQHLSPKLRKRYGELFRTLQRLDKGGAGSGNYGHSGRPGEIGGSGEGSAGGMYVSKPYDKYASNKKWAAANKDKIAAYHKAYYAKKKALKLGLPVPEMPPKPTSQPVAVTPKQLDPTSHEDENGLSKEWQSRLSFKELNAIKSYQHGSGINTYLRMAKGNDKNLGPSQQARVNTLDSAIGQKGVILDHDINVYRSFDGHDPNASVGDEVSDYGYMSTTLKPATQGWSGHGVVLTIPAGMRFGVMDSVSGGFGSEREVLLPRNSTFTVTSIGKSPMGYAGGSKLYYGTLQK